MADAIRIEGLREFTRSLKALDRDLPKAVRLALNEAAKLIIGYAQPNVPKRSGRAAGSIRAQSTQTVLRISAGGNRAPYYPWLDFGGRVGPQRSIARAFLPEGRILYPAYFRARDADELSPLLAKVLTQVARDAGLEVSS